MLTVSYRAAMLGVILVTAVMALTGLAFTAHAADVPPALLVNPASQVVSVEDKINFDRARLGFAPRRVDGRLQAAAASCFTRSDTCQDANAFLGLLASHGYPMGAVAVALGFGVSEDAVLSYWMADPVYRYRVYMTGGYSQYEDMGCAVQGIGYGVNLICFMATEYTGWEPVVTLTPTALPMPLMATPRPLPTRTPIPRWWR